MMHLTVQNAVRALRITWNFFRIVWRRRGEEWRGFRVFLEDELNGATRAAGPFVSTLKAAEEDLP